MSDGSLQNDGGNEIDDSEATMVFQCSKCNTIVGDSTAWLSCNTEMGSVTLNKVTESVESMSVLATSTKGGDLGSTYVGLRCKHCKENLGRIYKTTPRNLDDIRDHFTLSIPKINSYQVGSGVTNNNNVDLLDIPDQRYLLLQVRKIQALVIAFNSRIQELEHAIGITQNDGTQDNGPEHQQQDTNTQDVNLKHSDFVNQLPNEHNNARPNPMGRSRKIPDENQNTNKQLNSDMEAGNKPKRKRIK
ncbi:unnamed protein product [Owenia fusiformis]|uniref:Mis18 domain-containing protein n=1 Tax=Owenia fusiformis TaxID=6347 RepID=A0A8S4Q415_OWEFU|nr:unnamed protein product [Owenia fusiformis]